MTFNMKKWLNIPLREYLFIGSVLIALTLPLFVTPLPAWGDSPQEHADKHCRSEWTRLGILDHNMYDYCVKRDLDGLKKIEFFQAQYSKTKWFMDFAYPGCEQHWTRLGVKQFQMIAYCLEREKDGIDELNYESQQVGYDHELASLCFRKWQGNDTPFSMTAYCYKNDKNKKEYLERDAASQKDVRDLTDTLSNGTQSWSDKVMAWTGKLKSYLSWGKSIETKVPSMDDQASNVAPSTSDNSAPKLQDHSQGAEAVPLIDKIEMSAANAKVKRIFKYAESLAGAISIRGRIIAEKSFNDFPELKKLLRDLDINFDLEPQLLHVFVGSPALLITISTMFSTTGYFNMTVFKLDDTKTNQGEIPVFMEFRNYTSILNEYNKDVADIEKFTLQYAERELPKYQAPAEKLRNEASPIKLNLGEIASLLLVNEIGHSHEPDEANAYLFILLQAYSLCHIQKEGMNSTSWKTAFHKIVSVQPKLFISFPNTKTSGSLESLQRIEAKGLCADGGPFTYVNNTISFRQCMCSSHSEALDPRATRPENMKEFDKILLRLFPESEKRSLKQHAMKHKKLKNDGENQTH